MRRRPLAVSAALVLTASLGVACAPAAEPTEFANDDEAFAAAEATYRAYVDAVNEKRENPGSSADPHSFLTGHAMEASIRSTKRFEAEGIRLEGASSLAAVTLVGVDHPNVDISVCIDASATRLVNADGVDITPPDRGDRLPLEVTLTHRAGEFFIAHSVSEQDAC